MARSRGFLSVHDEDVLKQAHREVWEDERPNTSTDEKLLARFHTQWEQWVELNPRGKYVNAPLPAGVDATILRWVRMGLAFEDLDEYITKTMLRTEVAWKEKFTYFSACCWRRARRIASHAQRIVAAEYENDLPQIGTLTPISDRLSDPLAG